MRRIARDYDEDRQAESDRVTMSLASLAFALFLVVISLMLVQHLARKAKLEDCLMSGRVNCDAMLADIR